MYIYRLGGKIENLFIRGCWNISPTLKLLNFFEESREKISFQAYVLWTKPINNRCSKKNFDKIYVHCPLYIVSCPNLL